MMAACSVASRSSHARKDIAASETQEKTAAGKQQESAQPDSTVQDKTPGPVIKEVHHPVKRPASVRDSLSAADSALMAPRPTVSDSLLAIVNIGVATDSTPRPTVSDSLQVQSDTLQTDSTKTEKPLFKDVVEYNAADSIILDVPNKKTFLYKNAWLMLPVFLTVAVRSSANPNSRTVARNSKVWISNIISRQKKDLSKRSSPNKAKVTSRES